MAEQPILVRLPTNDTAFVVKSTGDTFQSSVIYGGSAISLAGTGNDDQWFGQQ